MTCTRCEQRRKAWAAKQRKAEEERKRVKAAAIGAAIRAAEIVGKIAGKHDAG